LLPVIAVAFLLTMFAGCRKKVPATTAVQPAIAAVETEPTPVKPKAEPEPSAIPDIPKVTTPERPAIVEPPGAPKPTAAVSSFDDGEKNFLAGKYAIASKSFQDYLQKNPKSPNRDVALFRLGVSLALAPVGAGRNMPRSVDILKRLVSEFPTSPYRGPADFILDLQSQVESLKGDLREREAKLKQLGDELQKLKEIDLQRRPSRPSS
jgi:hypothetical protein